MDNGAPGVLSHEYPIYPKNDFYSDDAHAMQLLSRNYLHTISDRKKHKKAQTQPEFQNLSENLDLWQKRYSEALESARDHEPGSLRSKSYKAFYKNYSEYLEVQIDEVAQLKKKYSELSTDKK